MVDGVDGWWAPLWLRGGLEQPFRAPLRLRASSRGHFESPCGSERARAAALGPPTQKLYDLPTSVKHVFVSVVDSKWGKWGWFLWGGVGWGGIRPHYWLRGMALQQTKRNLNGGPMNLNELLCLSATFVVMILVTWWHHMLLVTSVVTSSTVISMEDNLLKITTKLSMFYHMLCICKASSVVLLLVRLWFLWDIVIDRYLWKE